MPVLGYLEALDRFGLPELKQGDLQIKDGNIAVTADGDWQFGNTRINALFRHVERWRLNQPTRDELYAPMLITSQRRKDVLAARSQSVGASLVRNPVEFHEEKNPSLAGVNYFFLTRHLFLSDRFPSSAVHLQ